MSSFPAFPSSPGVTHASYTYNYLAGDLAVVPGIYILHYAFPSTPQSSYRSLQYSAPVSTLQSPSRKRSCVNVHVNCPLCPFTCQQQNFTFTDGESCLY
jgi:hypothetical protein